MAKIEDLAHKMRAAGHTVSDDMVMAKILLSLPSELRFFCSIWESIPNEKRTLENLIAHLMHEEERLGIHEQIDVDEALVAGRVVQKKNYNNQSSGQIPSNKNMVPTCSNCREKGHWRKICLKRDQQKSTGSGDEPSSSKKTSNSRKPRAATGRALIIQAVLSTPTVSIKNVKDKWYLDSGASDHMSSRKDCLLRW